jgi:hypothetical protein
MDLQTWTQFAKEVDRRISEEVKAEAAELSPADSVTNGIKSPQSPKSANNNNNINNKAAPGSAPVQSKPSVSVTVEFMASVGKSVTVTLRSLGETVGALKNKVAFSEAIPASTQVMLFDGKRLNDASSLEEAGLRHGSKVKLVISPQ